jgi:hypothetical protein
MTKQEATPTTEEALRNHLEQLVAGAPGTVEILLEGAFPDLGIQLARATELLHEMGYRFESAQSEAKTGALRARFRGPASPSAS